VKKGDTVAVVGDGALGLCAVLAARRLGADRIIALSRHADRQQVARESGATDIVAARPGSTVGIVGVPHGQVPFTETFFRNTGWRGGPAPARIYIPDLLGDVLDGAINPGLVFDYETDLGHISDAYRAMDERRAIKSLVRVGTA
jgi:threonine dehydrogenase-like Zn-dependent dehydrogenase